MHGRAPPTCSNFATRYPNLGLHRLTFQSTLVSSPSRSMGAVSLLVASRLLGGSNAPVETSESELRMPFRFGPFRINPAERVVDKDGDRVQIGSRAFDLLLVLAENSGEIVSKKQLTSRAWSGITVDEVGLRVHISGLRKILGNTPLGTPYITNVSGRGYMLAAPAEW